MPISTFEKLLPWTGVVAGLAWIAQDVFAKLYTSDVPGRGSVDIISTNLGRNLASLSCLVVMGVSLLFFATAVRNLLRSGEAREATYSSVAYAGWITVSAALAQMAVWNKGLMSAAEDGDAAATRVLSYAQYFGWLGMGDRNRHRLHRHRARRPAQRGPAQVVRRHHASSWASSPCSAPAASLPAGWSTTCSCRSGSSPRPSSSPGGRERLPGPATRLLRPPSPRSPRADARSHRRPEDGAVMHTTAISKSRIRHLVKHVALLATLLMAAGCSADATSGSASNDAGPEGPTLVGREPPCHDVDGRRPGRAAANPAR